MGLHVAIQARVLSDRAPAPLDGGDGLSTLGNNALGVAHSLAGLDDDAGPRVLCSQKVVHGMV